MSDSPEPNNDFHELSDEELDELAEITPQDIELSKQDAARHEELSFLNALLNAKETDEGEE